MKTLLGLSKQQRLLKKQEFQQVFRDNTVCESSYFSILYARKTLHPVSRLGIIVPKRRFKRAVIRNKLRRMVRESFRQYQCLQAGWDIVFVVKQDLGELKGHIKLQRYLHRQWRALASK